MDKNDHGATVDVGSGSPGAPGGASPQAVSAPAFTCTYWDLAPMIFDAMTGNVHRAALADATTPVGQPVGRRCVAADGTVLTSDLIPWPGVGAPAPPSGRAVAEQARAELTLPEPRIRTWPPPDQWLAGLETWFHTDTFTPQSATAAVTGVSATVTAQPARTIWHLPQGTTPDGITLTCTTAGRIWYPGDDERATTTDCGYQFQYYSQGQTLDAHVEVVYHLSWSATTGEAGDLGDVTVTHTFPARIWEIQALIN